MFWDDIRNWSGKICIDGFIFDSVKDAEESVDITAQKIKCITLYAKKENPCNFEQAITNPFELDTSTEKQYSITVRAYMTKPSSPGFDFMSQWNNDNPMPLRTMVGTIEKETRGMVYMKLHADITQKTTQRCMKCGKIITNPISQYFGMGPECGGHNYINPFSSDEELKLVVEKYRREYLNKITWEGWIIKSAIIEQEEL